MTQRTPVDTSELVKVLQFSIHLYLALQLPKKLEFPSADVKFRTVARHPSQLRSGRYSWPLEGSSFPIQIPGCGGGVWTGGDWERGGGIRSLPTPSLVIKPLSPALLQSVVRSMTQFVSMLAQCNQRNPKTEKSSSR